MGHLNEKRDHVRCCLQYATLFRGANVLVCASRLVPPFTLWGSSSRSRNCRVTVSEMQGRNENVSEMQGMRECSEMQGRNEIAVSENAG